MNQTPEHLLSPHKAAVLAAARELMHAAGTEGFAFEIPNTEPKQVIVVAPEAELGRLVDAPAREPMMGGRRKSDLLPQEPLSWDEPGPGEPRRWTILLTSKNYGLVGEAGAQWQAAHAGKYERVDVLEAGPVLARIAVLEERLAVAEEDAARVDWLEETANGPEGLLLHDGGDFTGRLGLGLRRIGRTLRQAVDAAMGKETKED